MSQNVTFKPGTKIKLSQLDPSYDNDTKKVEVAASVAEHVDVIGKLSYRLYAEGARALLVVLQGMDTSGKDGTIRQVMEAVDPMCCQVSSFKKPSEEELEHDFLWRIHRQTPPRGQMGVFNRSHYEDVVVVRVKNFAPKAVWQARYEQINAFEKMLVENGTTIVKVFLHISADEQRERLQARLDDPEKRWKFRMGDLDDRKLWDKFQEAYEDALTLCNTEHAPWHIVPANKKWYRNLVIARLLRKTLEEMAPKLPPPDPGLDGLRVP